MSKEAIKMWAFIGKFLLSFFGGKILGKALQKSLRRKLLGVLREWASSLPEGANLVPESIFVDPFIDHTGLEPLSSRGILISQIKSNGVPSEEEWYNALVERWQEVRSSEGEPQRFYLIPESEAQEHLRRLAKRLFDEWTEDEKWFRRATIDRVYQRGLQLSDIGIESVRKRLDTLLAGQIEKQKKSGKYIPEVFTENHDAKESCRLLAVPGLFWGKIIWSINGLSFSNLNRQLSESGIRQFGITLPGGIEQMSDNRDLQQKAKILLGHLREKIDYLQRLGHIKSNSLGDIVPKEKIESAEKRWHLVQGALYANIRNLEAIEEDITIVTKRVMLITSRAGRGKTNFLCDFAENVLRKRSIPSLLFSARDFDFDMDEMQEFLLKRIFVNTQGITTDQKYEILKRLSSQQNQPLIIIIDGLNESENILKFSAKLEELIEELLQYDFIRIILACRSEYIEYRFDNLKKASFAGQIFEIDRLEMRECEESKMIRNYFKFFKISGHAIGNAYYMLSQNPLLLRFFCEAYGDSGSETLIQLGTVSNIYRDQLFKEYLKKKFEAIIQIDQKGKGKRLGYGSLYKHTIEAIVENMINSKKYSNVPISGISGEFIPFLERLIHEDLIIRKDLATTPTGPFVVEVINFTFDELRDYLIAVYLIENIWPKDRKKFEQLTDSLIEIGYQFTGDQCHPWIRPLPIAEGVSRFLFQIIRHGHLTEIEQHVNTKQWYQDTLVESVFEIEDCFVKDEDVRQVKQFFLGDIHNSSSVCWHLLHRYELSQYENLNINVLFEIFRDLDSAQYHRLVDPVFQNYTSDLHTGHFTWRIDSVVRKLQQLLDSEEHFILFELLIFLFAVPSRNYLSPALDLYDEFTKLYPDLAIAQLLRNINVRHIGVRTHVWEKIGHLHESGFKIPGLKKHFHNAIAELGERPEADDYYSIQLSCVLSKISENEPTIASDSGLSHIKDRLKFGRNNKHVNNVWRRILGNRPEGHDA